MDVFYAVKKWSFEEFLEQYTPDQTQSASSVGQTMLQAALGNRDPGSRVQIAGRLLDDGADAAAVYRPENINGLHILFGQKRHDGELEAPLLERLLQGGADINWVSQRWGTPLQTLARELRLSDSVLAPFYDVVLARPGLALNRVGSKGMTTLATVEALGERRGDLLGRLQEYQERFPDPVGP